MLGEGRGVRDGPHRGGVGDVELAGTDQRHIAEAGMPGRGRRERGVEVVGGGEQHTDDVLMIDTVAFDHLGEQRDRPLLDLFDGVGIDGGGTPQGTD